MSGWWLVGPGMLVGLGLVLIGAAFRRQHPRLGDALGALADPVPDGPDAPPPTGADRLGGWWLARRPARHSSGLDRQLQLKGRTLTRHFTHKVVFALAGLTLPLAAGLAWWLATGGLPWAPALVALVAAAVGFVVPDVLLRAAGRDLADDATESLLTFFDLVTLERLANQSATQALHSAAGVSDVAVFAAIRAALDRARLEQRMPHAELKAVGRRLELPALVDLADVMRLDEAGASLSGALRARVRELRDAHLTARRTAAAEASERMTLFVVIPSLVFGLFFLVPPLLTLISSG